MGTIASPAKHPQISIQRWETRVSVSSPTISFSLCLLWQLCLFHRPHYQLLCQGFFCCNSPTISHIFSSPSSSLGLGLNSDCYPFSLQLNPLSWMADNYQPGDSSLFQELRGHQGFLGTFRIPEPNIPCENAGLLVVSFSLWWSMPPRCTPSLGVFSPMTGMQVRKNSLLLLQLFVVVNTAGQAYNCSHSSECEVMQRYNMISAEEGKGKVEQENRWKQAWRQTMSTMRFWI